MELSKAKNIKYNDKDAMAVAKNNVVRWKRGGNDNIKITIDATKGERYVVLTDAFADAVNNSVLLTDEKNRLTGKVFAPIEDGNYEFGYLYNGTVDFKGNFDGLNIDAIKIYSGINGNTIDFSGNTSIRDVYVEPTLFKDRSDYSYMFRGTKGLRSVNTQDWNIGSAKTDYMFATSNIEEVDLGNAEKIGPYAFNFARFLKNVKCPSVKIIGERAFYGCDKIESFDFSKVEEIHQRAFLLSSWIASASLKGELNLPNIRTILAYGIGSNVRFNSIHLGDKVENLDYHAFRDIHDNLMPSLNYVTVEQRTPFDLSAFDWNGYVGENAVAIFVPYRSYQGYVDAFSVGGGEQQISKGTFMRYTSINGDIITPNDNYLYASKENIIFAGEIKDISDRMFMSLPYLKSLYLEDINSIGTLSFWNCDGLEILAIDSVVPPNLSDTMAFNNTHCNIYVPDEVVNTYKTATNWSTLSNRIKPLSELPNE